MKSSGEKEQIVTWKAKILTCSQATAIHAFHSILGTFRRIDHQPHVEHECG